VLCLIPESSRRCNSNLRKLQEHRALNRVLLVLSVEIEAQSQSNQSPTQLSPEIAPFHARVGNELTLFSSASRLAINSRPKDGATDGVVPVRLGYSRVLVSSLPRRSLTHSLLSINSSGKKAIFHFIGSRRTLHGSLGEEDFIIIRSRVFDSKLSARSREKLKLFFPPSIKAFRALFSVYN
jgi:hypothetical protein